MTTAANIFMWLKMESELIDTLKKTMGAKDPSRPWAWMLLVCFACATMKLQVGTRELCLAGRGPGETSCKSRQRLSRHGQSFRAVGAEYLEGEPADVLPALREMGTHHLFGHARVKLAMVHDEGDDTEIKPLRVCGTEGAHRDVEARQQRREATGAPLSALHFRLLRAASPFVDFEAWRHTVPLYSAS